MVPLIGQTTSGRVKAVTLIDQKGEFIMIPNKVFRRMMGGLQSNLYTIQAAPKTGEILVKGLGNGHGVGMSQQGAAALAEHKSWNYQQILEYYYVRTSLCSLDTTGEDLPDCARESFKYSKQVAMQASR
ncbi:MAG: hypothetical protein NTX25_01310 [Proteobacteria bacterium]|nr:hypothetical protein [Pseudomonadota bacterium]